MAEPKRILVTGGTGGIGRRFVRSRLARGDEVFVLSRRSDEARRLFAAGATPNVHVLDGDPGVPGRWQQTVGEVEAVVHLAGAPIAARRWSPVVRESIRRSRIDGTYQVAFAIREAEEPPRVFVSASGTGRYPAGSGPIDESAAPGRGFLSSVAVAWEREAARAASDRTRVVLARIPTVLDRDAGYVARMSRWWRRGFDPGPWSGDDAVPWVHHLDLIRILDLAIDDDRLAGPVNCTAPAAARASEIRTALRAITGRHPMPVPRALLRWAAGAVIEDLSGSRDVRPAKLLAEGFAWKVESVSRALAIELGDGRVEDAKPAVPASPPKPIESPKPAVPPTPPKPVEPPKPVVPVSPPKPIEPPKPVVPVSPPKPVVPVSPPKPIEPPKPVVPVSPPKPVVPVSPPKPIEPLTPVVPPTPPKPIEPLTPVVPPTPPKPIEPPKPVVPPTPPKPIEPPKPVIPPTPPKPIEPPKPAVPPTPPRPIETPARTEAPKPTKVVAVAVLVPEALPEDRAPVREAIARWKARGVETVLACTGGLPTAAPLAQAIGHTGPLILDLGSSIRNGADRRLVRSMPIPDRIVSDLERQIASVGESLVCGVGTIDAGAREVVVRLDLVGDADSVEAGLAAIAAPHWQSGAIAVFRTGSERATIVAGGVDKSAALQRILRGLGLPPSRVVVAAAADEDLGLVDWCRAIVVGAGSERLRASAARTADRGDWRAIESFVASALPGLDGLDR